jgi:hypothetical protein
MAESVDRIETGDIVEVHGAPEILKTLNSDGTLDNLPFMPEMVAYCGKRFRVLRKANRTCVTCMNPDLTIKMSEFINDDVYFLDGLRCSGADHGPCDRGCMIFWKAAWLRRVDDMSVTLPEDAEGVVRLRNRLAVKTEKGTYFCQSTQLLRAVNAIPKSKKISKLFEDIRSGTYGGMDAFRATVIPVLLKVAGVLKDVEPRGNLSKTPHVILNLQPGEVVEVKSLREIESTLDAQGKNRGLTFISDMKRYCGKLFKVRNRLNRAILEHKGEMIEMNGTVILEENTCTYDHTFGGCPRNEFNFWREIWLKRVNE